MQLLRTMASWVPVHRTGVRNEEWTSVAPRPAWPSPSQQQGGHQRSARPDRQVHPVSASARVKPSSQRSQDVGRTSPADHGCHRTVTALRGLWKLDDKNLDQRLVHDLDKTLLVLSDCVQNCKGERYPIVIRNAGTQVVLGDGILGLNVHDKTLRCTLPSGQSRIYHRLLLPSARVTSSLQGTWRAMRCKNKRKDAWTQVTISDYCFKGTGPGCCNGFLQVADGCVKAGANSMSLTEDCLMVSTSSGQRVRYFRLRGRANLDPIAEWGQIDFVSSCKNIRQPTA